MVSPWLPSCSAPEAVTCTIPPPESGPLSCWRPPAASASAQPARSIAAAVVFSRVTNSWPRSVPTGSGRAATISTSPAATCPGPVPPPPAGGSGLMMKSSGHTVSWIWEPVPYDVVQVAPLQLLQQEQLVIAVHWIGPQPGVKTIKVREPRGQIGDDTAKQLGPDDQLLQAVEVGDGGRAIRVGDRAGPQPHWRLGVPGRLRHRGQMGAKVGGQGGIKRRVGMAGGQQPGVDRLVDQGLVNEYGGAVGALVVAGIDEGDQAAVGVDPVRQHMATKCVLVGGLDLVGQVIEEDHVGEAELGQQRIAGCIGSGQFLVGFLEVGLEGVDGFQADRDAAGVDVGWAAGAAWEGLDQGWGVGEELDGVAVGLGTLAGQVRVADDKASTQQGVWHEGQPPPNSQLVSGNIEHPQAANAPIRMRLTGAEAARRPVDRSRHSLRRRAPSRTIVAARSSAGHIPDRSSRSSASLPSRSDAAGTSSPLVFERLLRTVDPEKPHRPRAIELQTNRIAVGNRLVERLNRAVRFPSDTHDGAWASVGQRKESFSHVSLEVKRQTSNGDRHVEAGGGFP